MKNGKKSKKMVDYTQDFELRGVPVSATELMVEMYILLIRCKLRSQKECYLWGTIYKSGYTYPSYVCQMTSMLFGMCMAVPKELSKRVAREALDFIKREKDVDMPYILRLGTRLHGININNEDDLIAFYDNRLRYGGLANMMRPFIHTCPNASLCNERDKWESVWEDINIRWNEHIDAMVRRSLADSRLPNTFMKDYIKRKFIFSRRRILGFSKFYKAASKCRSTKS